MRRLCPTAAQPTSSSSATATAEASGAEQGQQTETEQLESRRQSPEGERARQYIRRLLEAPPSMHSVALSPCGSLLFTSSLGPKDSSIRVWRLLPGRRDITAGSTSGNGGSTTGCAELQPELHRTLTGHTAPVLSLALTPDGSLLLSGSHDQSIRVWRTADWHCLRVLKGHGGGLRALAVAPDALTLYSAAADNTVRVRCCCGSWCRRVGQQRGWGGVGCRAWMKKHNSETRSCHASGCLRFASS